MSASLTAVNAVEACSFQRSYRVLDNGLERRLLSKGSTVGDETVIEID